jgi:hypothetical protein
MSKAHYITPTGPTPDVMVVRLGASRTVGGVPGTGGSMTFLEESKFVKLVGESQYDLCASGDAIEAQIVSVEAATSDGWTIGGVRETKEVYVTAAGLQATEGTGNIAIGDYVVAGTQDAKGVAMTTAYPKVLKAAVQVGAVPATLAEAGAQSKLAAHAWRVVSLGPVGSGAPGTTIVITRLGS